MIDSGRQLLAFFSFVCGVVSWKEAKLALCCWKLLLMRNKMQNELIKWCRRRNIKAFIFIHVLLLQYIFSYQIACFPTDLGHHCKGFKATEGLLWIRSNLDQLRLWKSTFSIYKEIYISMECIYNRYIKKMYISVKYIHIISSTFSLICRYFSKYFVSYQSCQ